MGTKQYKQFIKTQMRQEQPDKEKLIKLAFFMGREYSLTMQREAILMFDKVDDHLVNFASWLTEEQFKKHTIHVPDLLFFVGKKMWIIEIDGYIHNTNTTVAIKDIERNRCYKSASLNSNLNFEIINEWECLLELGINPNRAATPKEIIPEIKRRMAKILS